MAELCPESSDKPNDKPYENEKIKNSFIEYNSETTWLVSCKAAVFRLVMVMAAALFYSQSLWNKDLLKSFPKKTDSLQDEAAS